MFETRVGSQLDVACLSAGIVKGTTRNTMLLKYRLREKKKTHKFHHFVRQGGKIDICDN